MAKYTKPRFKCVVCSGQGAPFQCNRCRSKYCSAKCFQKHKLSLDETVKRATAVPDAAADAIAAMDPPALKRRFGYLCEVIYEAQEPEREREFKRQRAEAEADVFSDVSREKISAAPGGQPRGQAGDTAASPAEAAPVPQPQETSEAPQTGGERAQAAPPTAQQPASNGTADEAGEVEVDADALYILQGKHLSALADNPNLRNALRHSSLQKLIRTVDSSRSRLDALDAAQYNNQDFKRFCDEVMRTIARVEGR